jgi:hypothetical protein
MKGFVQGVDRQQTTLLPDGRFGLTPLGELLRSNVPGSMRNPAIALTAPGQASLGPACGGRASGQATNGSRARS